MRTAHQEKIAQQLDSVVVEIEPSARILHEQSRLANLVGSVLDDRSRMVRALSGVFLVTPASINLEGLTFERSREELQLRGSSSSTEHVLDYISKLKDIHGIEHVQLKYSTRRSTPSGERTDFKLILTVRG